MTTAEQIYKYNMQTELMLKLWELDIKLFNLGSDVVIWSMTTVKPSYRPSYTRWNCSQICWGNATQLINLRLAIVFLQTTTDEPIYKYMKDWSKLKLWEHDTKFLTSVQPLSYEARQRLNRVISESGGIQVKFVGKTLRN